MLGGCGGDLPEACLGEPEEFVGRERGGVAVDAVECTGGQRVESGGQQAHRDLRARYGAAIQLGIAGSGDVPSEDQLAGSCCGERRSQHGEDVGGEVMVVSIVVSGGSEEAELGQVGNVDGRRQGRR